MSDPVTNVEIEDVLSSIRRLVSDGDKARTRDPAPAEAAEAAPVTAAETPPESTDAAGGVDRLVLTPAFLVVDGDGGNAPDDIARDGDDEHVDAAQDDMTDDDADTTEDWHEEDWGETPADTADDEDNTSDDGPLELTDRVAPDADEVADTPDDRAGLVATIAELEAAISAGEDDFEPDGSEVMTETVPWPASGMREIDAIEDAEMGDEPTAEDAANDMAGPEQDEAETADNEPASSIQPDPEPTGAMPADDADEYTDDDLDGLLEAGGATLDEDALRELVAEVVREELTGPLGERITRNVRKLVRREIYRILSSQEFD